MEKTSIRIGHQGLVIEKYPIHKNESIRSEKSEAPGIAKGKKEKGDINFEPPIDDDEIAEKPKILNTPTKQLHDFQLSHRVDNLENAQRELKQMFHELRRKDAQDEMANYPTLEQARNKYQFITSIREKISHFEYVAGRKFNKLRIDGEVLYSESDFRIALALNEKVHFSR